MIRGGRSLVSAPPAFSNDAKKLLVCTGNTISIFSTATGLQITEMEGHTSVVTSIVVVPASPPASKILCYCWTASLDGTIRYWDFSLPELMKTIDVRFPVYSMVIPVLFSRPSENDKRSNDVFAYISTKNKEDRVPKNDLSGQIRKCNLTAARLAGGVTLAEIKTPGSIVSSPNGTYFGIFDKHKLRIWKVPSKDTESIGYQKLRLHHTKKFSALAFHPMERIVAAGDVTGRILIWRRFGRRTFVGHGNLVEEVMKNEDDRPGVRQDDDADSCTTWHWHSAEVKVLFFSSDGAYLYSGGREGVLVVWQLETGKKKFLPRVGSPLSCYISSPDPLLSAISCTDNRIHLLTMPSMETLRTISGIKLPGSVPETYEGLCSGFAFDCTAGLVAIRAENYCIQFYSLFDDREISEVQVCERNHQPGDEVTVIVNLIALSVDGSVMSTVETRLSEEGLGGLVSLKFWECGSQNKQVSLSTIVYEPHRDANVSSIAFHPSRRMAVSSSYGGDFKIWVSNHEVQKNDNIHRIAGWACHAVGAYKKKPMTAAAFSADGSVLAVAAETVVTLWDPEKNVLLAVVGETVEAITALSFVGNSDYLVSSSRGTNPQLSVWSMSKLSLFWSYKLQAEAVACAKENSSFVVLALLPKSSEGEESNRVTLNGHGGLVLVFSAEDPIPLAAWSVRKAKGGGVAFIHRRSSVNSNANLEEKPTESLLAYINGNHEYALFNPAGAEEQEHHIIHKQSLIEPEQTAFGYASLYGELPVLNLRKNQTVQAVLAPSERPWETIFSGSSHNLPPLTKLCSVFLESLLEKRSTTVE